MFDLLFTEVHTRMVESGIYGAIFLPNKRRRTPHYQI